MGKEKYAYCLDIIQPKYLFEVSTNRRLLKKEVFLEIQRESPKKDNIMEDVLKYHIMTYLEESFLIDVDEIVRYKDLNEFFMVKGGLKSFSEDLGISVKELIEYIIFTEKYITKTNPITLKLKELLYDGELANLIYTLIYHIYTDTELPFSYKGFYTKKFMNYLPRQERVKVHLGELPRKAYYVCYLNFTKNPSKHDMREYTKNVIVKVKELYPEFKDDNIVPIPYVSRVVTKNIVRRYGSVTNFLEGSKLTLIDYNNLYKFQKLETGSRLKEVSEASNIDLATLIVSAMIDSTRKTYRSITHVFDILSNMKMNRRMIMKRKLKEKGIINESE